MTEIRCPMCSKMNSAEAEVCQYCQARLKPLIIPPQPEGGMPIPASGPSETGEAKSSDWLSDFRQQEELVDLEGEGLGELPELTPEEELPDWLARLDGQEKPLAEIASEQVEPEMAEAEPVDWQAGAGEAETIIAQPTESEETLPEWLSKVQPAEQAEELPDWLKEITPAKQEAVEPTVEIESVPDLLGEGVAEGETDLPDWLKEPSYEPDTATIVSTSGSEAQDEEPDWLRRVRDRAREDELSQPAAPFLFTEEQLFTEELEEPSVPKEELPDWLARRPSKEIEQGEQVSEAPLQPIQEGSEVTPTVVEEPPEEAPQVSAGQEDLLGMESERPKPGVVAAFTTMALDEEEALSGEGLELDWLTQLEAEEQSSAEISPPQAPFVETGEESLPEELPGEAASEEPLFGEVPDWFAQVSEEALPQEPPGEEAIAEPELAPVLLPGWLETMRPVEAAVPSAPVDAVVDQEAETAGPLVGLRGVLLAEPDIARIRKPTAYSIKLRVTESQQARVTMLEELLAAEDKPKSLPGQPIISPQYVVRLIIALVLIVPVFTALWRGVSLVPMPNPALAPQSVIDANALIASIPANAPVLLAFDYEAGFSGEMDTAAMAAVSGLMNRGAFLTLVSTLPSGPAMAERFIARMNSLPERSQAPFTNYTNLGYIPGGTVGLSGLVEAPWEVLPYALDAQEVWGTAPLNTVFSLAGFSLVMVISESPDTARAWIEQVGPALQAEGVPLLMVVSAQAEPLIQPYYVGKPKQVNGLIAGMSGGAAYESLTGQEGLARQYWDAFGAGLLIAEMVILVGGFIGLFSSFLADAKKRESKEKA